MLVTFSLSGSCGNCTDVVAELSLYIGTNVPYYIINQSFQESELVTRALVLRIYKLDCINRATVCSGASKNRHNRTNYFVQYREV